MLALVTDLAAMPDVPGPRVGDVTGVTEPTQHQAVQQLHQGDDGDLRHDPDATRLRVADPAGAQPVPHLEATAIVDRASSAQRLEMSDASTGGHDHSGADHVGAPRKVEIFAEHLDTRIESSQRLEQVRPHEGGGAGHEEDVTHRVVLFLVEFASLHVGRRGTRLVGTHADLQDSLRVVPIDDLAADHAGIRSVGLLDHHLHDIRIEPDVVMAEQVERGTIDRVQDLVGGRTEADVAPDTAEMRMGRDRGDAIFEVDRAAAVDDQE
jgi:hypothetical protein